MKSAAHPREYHGDGPIHIPEAYCELSQEAFAVWIRLMVEPTKTLSHGRTRLAKLMKYSYRRFNAVLQELVRKGYVQLHRPEFIGDVTMLSLRRKAVINQRTGSWVKLG